MLINSDAVKALPDHKFLIPNDFSDINRCVSPSQTSSEHL